MLERDIQKKCVAYARKRSFWASKFVAQGRRSAPDYIFATKGYPAFFVEFKRPGQRPTEQQSDFHDQMREAGLHVHVCSSLEQFITVLDFEMDALA